MRLVLQEADRQSEYHYRGMIKLKDLADAFKDYHFSEEVLQKAEIQKTNIAERAVSFLVTVRLDPDSTVDEEGETVIFHSSSCDLRDGKSKAAAVCLMEQELIGDAAVPIEVFAVSKEKMDKLEGNRK